MERITTTSETGIELITHFESFQPNAYLCPAGVWTIGYGTTRYASGAKVCQGDRITKDDAMKLLYADLRQFEKAVDNYTRDDIKQHEFDALVSLCYNIGPANFKNASLLTLVNQYSEDKDRINIKFLLWNKATVDGKLKELPGLTRRRRAEAYLFNTGELKFFEDLN